ncbi:hypothetical protein FHN55_09055 [Streptomyces sp. NP160]|uniref:hypothetical protein n=1 Tax=Streptomyces sp. NP160 TaxID=2586637 RepID=UPI00111925BC|nr:hypothetical protein [Streptomyces sp. NP160]TNM67595.1 hypothetical protein FHN55_09055 [Streptomyces sp. NP160]
MTTTPTAAMTADLTEGPSAEAALESARHLLTALTQHARNEGEQARAQMALAHLDDVWPLRAPVDAADVDGIDARGAVLLDEAMSALVSVVATAEDAQARARALRALALLTSNLDMPGDVPADVPAGQP